MKKKEFKVEDRIRYIGVDKDYSGKCGTIIVVDNSVNLLPYGVKFDERIAMGHDLNEQCEDGYGLWVGADDIKLVYSTLESYTDQELKDELKRRKDKERIEVIEELKKCLVKLSIPEFYFKDYYEGKTTEELKNELKIHKDCQVDCLVNTLNNIINDLKDLGYTIPYEENTIIKSLEFNKVFDKIGVFYE